MTFIQIINSIVAVDFANLGAQRLYANSGYHRHQRFLMTKDLGGSGSGD